MDTQGYRCNNGFIDSFGTFNYSEQPVLENLQLMATEYYNDSYFVDKAILYLDACDVNEASAFISAFGFLMFLAKTGKVKKGFKFCIK